MSENDAAFSKDRRNSIGVLFTTLLVGGLGMFIVMGNRSVTICKRTEPLGTAISLESAVNNFQTEYGVLPSAGNHIQTDGPDGVRFLNILLGLEGDSAQKQNPRSIKFLSVREAKGRRNGLQYEETGNRVAGLYDVWGNPFIVEINVKNEDKLRFKLGGSTVELPGRLAAAYSPGKDGKPGTSDDVKTW